MQFRGEVVSEKMSRMELLYKTDLCAGRTEPGSGDRYSQADGILSSDGSQAFRGI